MKLSLPRAIKTVHALVRLVVFAGPSPGLVASLRVYDNDGRLLAGRSGAPDFGPGLGLTALDGGLDGASTAVDVDGKSCVQC